MPYPIKMTNLFYAMYNKKKQIKNVKGMRWIAYCWACSIYIFAIISEGENSLIYHQHKQIEDKHFLGRKA